jgi:hypothetical protein
MKYLLFIFLLIAIISVAGCISESKEKATPVITSPVITPSVIPTTAAQKMIKTTTVVPTKTTPTPTVVPSKPIASPVTVNGTSGHTMRFYTVAPGIVKFTIRYSSSLGDKGEFCSDDDRAIIRLAGASTDKTLYNDVAKNQYSGTTTYNLISPGNYSLTTKGCYGWQVNIDNA